MQLAAGPRFAGAIRSRSTPLPAFAFPSVSPPCRCRAVSGDATQCPCFARRVITEPCHAGAVPPDAPLCRRAAVPGLSAVCHAVPWLIKAPPCRRFDDQIHAVPSLISSQLCPNSATLISAFALLYGTHLLSAEAVRTVRSFASAFLGFSVLRRSFASRSVSQLCFAVASDGYAMPARSNSEPCHSQAVQRPCEADPSSARAYLI